ncbi:protein UBASH3A homolog isoform X4 [Anopheles funestus]|uniref:protein UBASH3A homolog isoform X4 n=1 Tax=Anopheles funestus TaxID=62324 RepID=UPI0020C603F9|nr:protein UBASH3A homolog isoform X4 [Anopheles funestus]
MAALPPRKNPTPTKISKQHLTPLQILLQMGFPKHRAEKALAATGNRGVQLASDWLLAHVNDPFLDECAPREYILYACPTGPFLQQLENFWAQSREACGWNGAHNFTPHITLVSFFKAPDECAPQLSKALKELMNLPGARIDRPIGLELYTSPNFMGFFVAEDDANYLKRLALQYVKEVSHSIISDTYEQLDALVTCFPWCGGVTSARCIPRSSRLSVGQSESQPDTVLVASDKTQPTTEQQTADERNSGKMFGGTKSQEEFPLERLHELVKKHVNNIQVIPGDEGAQLKLASKPESSTRKVYLMRHGERIDFTFGTWVPYCFDEAGNYVRKDLNMPKTLPDRKPSLWQRDSPLTNVGRYQALLVGEGMKDAGVHIEKVYCSPSFRCIQTATSVLEGLGLKATLPICIEPGLFEWLAWYQDGIPEWLSNEELIAADYNIATDYKPMTTAEDLKEHFHEKLGDFYCRNSDIAESIISTTEGNVLIVGHATTLDTCSRFIIGEKIRSTNDMGRIMQKVSYCSLAVMESDGTATTADADTKNKVKGYWKLAVPPCDPVTHTNNNRFDYKVLSG